MAASKAGIAWPSAPAAFARDNLGMWLIIVEALAAGLILVLIVWWTMFSGRRGGERHSDAAESTGPTDPADSVDPAGGRAPQVLPATPPDAPPGSPSELPPNPTRQAPPP